MNDCRVSSSEALSAKRSIGVSSATIVLLLQIIEIVANRAGSENASKLACQFKASRVSI